MERLDKQSLNRHNEGSRPKGPFRTPNKAAKRLLEVIKIIEMRNKEYNNDQTPEWSSYSYCSDYSDHEQSQNDCFDFESPASDQLVSNISNHHSKHKEKKKLKKSHGLRGLSHDDLLNEISLIEKQVIRLDKEFQKIRNDFGFTF